MMMIFRSIEKKINLFIIPYLETSEVGDMQ